MAKHFSSKTLLLLCCALLLNGCGEKARTCPNGQFLEISSLDNISLNGKITIETHDLQGKPYKPYVLKLKTPVCITAPQEDERLNSVILEPINRVQLAGEFQKEAVYKSFGRAVTVNGTLFAPYTGWHIAPLLIRVSEIK